MSASEGEDEEFAVAVDADLAGGRLDAVLAKALPPSRATASRT